MELHEAKSIKEEARANKAEKRVAELEILLS
jgi:hypothetical protein